MFGQKKWIPYMVGIAVLFLAGVTTGYYAWGIDHQRPPNYKRMLYQTASYIDGLENQIKASGKPLSEVSGHDQASFDRDLNGFGRSASGDQFGERKLPATSSETSEKISAPLEQTGEQVNAEHQGTNDMPEQNSQPQVIIAELLKTRDALEEENTVLRAVVSDKKELVAGNEQLQKENKTLKEQLAQLEIKSSEMQASILKAETLAIENAKLQEEIVSLRGKIDTLKIRLSKISALVNDANSQMETPSSQEPAKSTETKATDTQE
jgi:hypothetical protein